MNIDSKIAKLLIVGVLTCVGFLHEAATVPTSPTPTITKYQNHIKVSWATVTGATSYKLYRSTSKSFSSASLIYSGHGKTIYDTTAELGVTYYYWLRVRVDPNRKRDCGCCCYEEPSGGNSTVLYKKSRRAAGWRKVDLKVSEVRSDSKVYLGISVNGKYLPDLVSVTASGVHTYHKYLKKPYICYFTSKRKGKGKWVVTFGKTKTVTASGTIKW